jgi:hypothetical protein
VIARELRNFRGATLDLTIQRELFRRWTTDPAVHPHEALVGLLALLHGATNQDLRGLMVSDTTPANRSVQLGSRPHPTPLDPPPGQRWSGVWLTARPSPLTTHTC